MTGPSISYCTLDDVAEATGCVVVIDVLRAYTTASVAIAQGAGPYELVSTLEEAYARRDAVPGTKLLGEVGGVPAEGFDFGNSPSAIDGLDLTGVPIVHRSSAGTQGVVLATGADRVLCASFLVASATARAVAAEPHVTFCVTGAVEDITGRRRDGDEDRTCGEYIAALLATPDGTPPPAPGPYLDRIDASDAGQLFFDPSREELPPEDVPVARSVDRYAFAMEVRTVEGRHLLERVLPTGTTTGEPGR